jgi:hypothetical protein
MALPDYLVTLIERRNWLSARIEAKKSVGWDIEWDTRERDSLTVAIDKLTIFETLAAQ